MDKRTSVLRRVKYGTVRMVGGGGRNCDALNKAIFKSMVLVTMPYFQL